MKKVRWRFHLRTILLLVVIVALGLALVVQRRDAVRREQSLIAEYRRMRIIAMQQEDRARQLESQLKRRNEVVDWQILLMQRQLDRAHAELDAED